VVSDQKLSRKMDELMNWNHIFDKKQSDDSILAGLDDENVVSCIFSQKVTEREQNQNENEIENDENENENYENEENQKNIQIEEENEKEEQQPPNEENEENKENCDKQIEDWAKE